MIITKHEARQLEISSRGAIKLRHGDDQEIFAEAVRRAGDERQLARVTKIDVNRIRQVVRGQALASDASAHAISGYLDNTPNTPLRRSGMSYCPSCAGWVPESHMREQVGRGQWVTLERCKECSLSTRIVSDKARQSAVRGA